MIAYYLSPEGFDENPIRIVKNMPTPVLDQVLGFSGFAQMQEIPPLGTPWPQVDCHYLPINV